MENEILREHEVRVLKVQKLKESGVLPYAYRFDRTHEIGQALEQFDKLVADKTAVRVAGRLLSRREHGKTCFGHIADGSGKIQLYVRKDMLDRGGNPKSEENPPITPITPISSDSESVKSAKSADEVQTPDRGERPPATNHQPLTAGMTGFDVFLAADIGDFIGVAGELMTTKTGEKTVLVRELEFLSKAFRPLPEKFHGFKDVEARYRQRYVDLIANPEVKSIFVRRAKIVSLIRRYLDGRGFTEVETPVLQPVYGGAAAHPFTTKYEALDQNMFLRISDELYLKRLIVGGMDKVYEFGRDFRNEGLDRTHNPEFTQLELYEAYRDYNDMMALVEELFRLIALELYGKTEIVFEGKTLDFGKPWQRLEFVPALTEKLGTDPLALGQESLRKLCARFGIETAPDTPKGKLLDKLFSELIQDHLVEPTFVMNHPKITTPLAKQHRNNPELVERFEPVVCGMELGNAFSELNDPAEQSARFKELMAANEEFATFDADYVTALEYGMPPCGGLGIGIDRLTMLFTGNNTIREVILFPQLRVVSSE